ncbi:hypothetical protein [Coleofasciculus sp. FACHB-T130]|uniref:hypothetical protein n=1 Tax=Cyanophyceae TaxID=3028117 RepID=UPI00168398BD|nr:hypothetical protein [Coleofasciculus sp. FACHB-T130]MBD1881196.1 hypothetical protein [Coleofasciculus sp. FACHB-T130]
MSELFSRPDTDRFLQKRRNEMLSEINSEQVKSVDYFDNKYKVKMLRLRNEKPEVKKQDQFFVYSIPFEGEPELFYYTPPTYEYSTIKGQTEISNGEVLLKYPKNISVDIDSLFKADLHELKDCIKAIAPSVERFNSSISSEVLNIIGKLSQKDCEDQNYLEKLKLGLNQEDI